MLEEIKQQLYSEKNLDLDRRFCIKLGKSKYLEFNKDIEEYANKLIEAMSVTLNANSAFILNNPKKELAGFQFDKIFIPGYGHIKFEHDKSLGDNEYKIEEV